MTKSKSRFSPLLKQCYVTGAICANIVDHGCVIGFPAVLLPQLMQPGSIVKMDSDAGSWIASVMGVSMLFGNFLSPPVVQRFGRKVAHFTVLAPVMVGWLLTILATGFTQLVIARILQGLSIGMMMSLRSILIGEYTSPKYRGALLTMISFSQAFGIFFVHAMGSLISWQRTAMICMFFSFISLLMFIHVPESPSWLVTKGRYEECKYVFRWIRGDDDEEELEEMIEASLILKKTKTAAIQNRKNTIESVTEMCQVIKKKEFYKPIVLMAHAYFMVQFTGGTVMASYSTKVIGSIVGPEANVNFWMVALDTQRIIFNAMAIFIINKVKRRTMMFATGGLCVFSHLAIAAYVYTKTIDKLPFDGLWIPIMLINMQFISVAVGMIPLPSVIAGEVFPLEFRGIGSSISVISLAFWLFIVLKTFPGLLVALGLHGTYTLFAGVLSYNLLVIWYLLPETKGKTLQQIEEEFRGGPVVCEDVETKSCQDKLLASHQRRISERRLSQPIL